MSAWVIPPIPGFLDTGVAPEFYIDSIGGMEISNGNVRVYLISTQARMDPDGAASHKLVQVKLVGPLLNVPQIIGQLAMCLWQPKQDCRPPRGQAPHLVP